MDIFLGRPTDSSITLSVLCSADTSALVAYGTRSGVLPLRTGIARIQKDQPQEILLEKLKADTRYYYELRDGTAQILLAKGTFHTSRPAGSSFTFTVTADSHLDENTDLKLYQRTLANAAEDAPDFHIDLGDTFMSEKHDNRENATSQYLAQRYFFGQIAASTPLFLVVGNHDGESPRGHGCDARGLAVWSNAMRTRYSNREFPRLCRGGSSSLTFPGIHPETLRGEPPSTHQGESGWTSMKA